VARKKTVKVAKKPKAGRSVARARKVVRPTKTAKATRVNRPSKVTKPGKAARVTSDARDFDLGVLYYQSSPTILAVVRKGGAAEKMGFKSGDRILSVGGEPVALVWHLKLGLRSAGKKARVVFEREGRQQDREVEIQLR
jgi:S1-C subfamily serine protease